MSIEILERIRYSYPHTNVGGKFVTKSLCECSEILCDIEDRPVCKVDGKIVFATNYIVTRDQIGVKSFIRGAGENLASRNLKMVFIDRFMNLYTLTELSNMP